jgi:uncharacterized protein YciU (UPF0263 family)
VFLSKTVGARVVNDDQMKRQNTGSNALEFTAVNSKYDRIEDAFSNLLIIHEENTKEINTVLLSSYHDK